MTGLFVVASAMKTSWITHIEVMGAAVVMTAEDVARRIAAKCTFIDCIRLEPVAAIARPRQA